MVFKLIRPDYTEVWARFPHYKGLIDQKEISRYIIAKTLKCEYNDTDLTEALTLKLKSISSEFKDLLNEDPSILKSREIVKPSYLELIETLANRYLESCIFCERQCKVNRIDGEKGYCLIGKESYISSAFLHMGEESVLVPSGTIFFQGCNFGCIFCQNYDISQAWKNRRLLSDVAQMVSKKDLALVAEKLVKRGAININYVGGDPIPNIHTIVGSLKFQQSNICQLWNSNFYLTEDSLDLIIDLMDFWLPDFKYGNNKCAKALSGVDNYFDVISRNHKRIHDEGSGEIIIRHLVMPNHIECCSKPIMDFVAREVPNCVVNIMGQYRPEYKAYNNPQINRRPTIEEIHEVKQHADDLGILYKPVS